MEDTKKLGFDGEAFVASWLQKSGFILLEKNFRTKFGEIDLICQKEDLLVFVEVKTRRSTYFQIASVVNLSKQKKIIHIAKYYIYQNQIQDKICRFDVASILFKDSKYEIEYFEDAFQEQF